MSLIISSSDRTTVNSTHTKHFRVLVSNLTSVVLRRQLETAMVFRYNASEMLKY